VFKATYDDQEQPKIKHVKALVQASSGTGINTNVDIIVDNLYKRLQAGKWNEILKTLVVIHTLTSVHGIASERMLKIISIRKPLNSTEICGAFVDDRSAESKGQSRFVISYANYLYEKFETFKTIDYSHERAQQKDDNKWVSGLTLEVVFQALPHLQKQLESALQCEPYQWNGKVHPIGSRATELILKDAFRLYSGINLMLVNILERHGSLTLQQAEMALECGKKDGTLHEKFMVWSNSLQELGFLKDKDSKEKKGEEETLDEGEIPSSPAFAQSVSESIVSVFEILVKSLKKQASGQLKTSTPGPKSRGRSTTATKMAQPSSNFSSTLGTVHESNKPPSRSASPRHKKSTTSSKQTSKTSSPKEVVSTPASPRNNAKSRGGSPEVVTEQWDPFGDFDPPTTTTTTQRPQRSASAAPPRSAPPTVTKQPRPSSTRNSTLPTVSDKPSDELDLWADLTSTTTNSSPKQETPSQPPKQRRKSQDHFTSLLSVNPSLPPNVVPSYKGGLGVPSSTNRTRSTSAAPVLDTSGTAQYEVLAIQQQLEVLQAAQAALAARLGQLSFNMQPVLPVTPRLGTSPDYNSQYPVQQSITTPVPFSTASSSSSGTKSTSATSVFDDPFADFA